MSQYPSLGLGNAGGTHRKPSSVSPARDVPMSVRLFPNKSLSWCTTRVGNTTDHSSVGSVCRQTKRAPHEVVRHIRGLKRVVDVIVQAVRATSPRTQAVNTHTVQQVLCTECDAYIIDTYGSYAWVGYSNKHANKKSFSETSLVM